MKTSKKYNSSFSGNDMEIGTFIITNKEGFKAVFTNFGLHLMELHVPDRKGNFGNVVLGFDTIEEYQQEEANYIGSVIGRYANRIGNGRFKINGKTYQVTPNEGNHHLHGGIHGFHKKVWSVEQLTENAIIFSTVSKDGEEGYPGNLKIKVTYEMLPNGLFISYWAQTDKPTHVNLTNHTYFNLSGGIEHTIFNHKLKINAEKFLPVDNEGIPNNGFLKVDNTPFDFRQFKAIGSEIDRSHHQIKRGNGYDQSFLLNVKPKKSNKLSFAAEVIEPKSGRVMRTYTTEPDLHLYTGNHFDGNLKGRNKFVRHCGFCLETQHFPDSPNRPEFPSTILLPNEEYKSQTFYQFFSFI